MDADLRRHDGPSAARVSLIVQPGMTHEEYDVWLLDTDALPQILAARRTGRRLKEVVAEYVAALQRAARPQDRSSLYALGHWLGSQSGC